MPKPLKKKPNWEDYKVAEQRLEGLAEIRKQVGAPPSKIYTTIDERIEAFRAEQAKTNDPESIERYNILIAILEGEKMKGAKDIPKVNAVPRQRITCHFSGATAPTDLTPNALALYDYFMKYGEAASIKDIEVAKAIGIGYDKKEDKVNDDFTNASKELQEKGYLQVQVDVVGYCYAIFWDTPQPTKLHFFNEDEKKYPEDIWHSELPKKIEEEKEPDKLEYPDIFIYDTMEEAIARLPQIDPVVIRRQWRLYNK